MGETFEWVEIIEPTRHEHMFANLKTGQCLWDAPPGVSVKPSHENQWWELYDSKTKRYYYYNADSQETVWYKPKEGDIIPLSKLQMLKNRETAIRSSSSTPRKQVVDDVNTGDLDTQPDRKSEYIGNSTVPTFSRVALQDNEQICIKDSEIISSSSNSKRGGGRTWSVDNSMDPPAIKEKPKFSSLRLKAPPKPPRSSRNVFGRSGDISNALEEKALNRNDVEIDKSDSAVSCYDHGLKCSEVSKSPHSSKPIFVRGSSADGSSENTILKSKTHYSSAAELQKDKYSSTLECIEYTSPSGVISTYESLGSFSPKEENTSLSPQNCVPLITGYSSGLNISKSIPVSRAVEYACPLRMKTHDNEVLSQTLPSRLNGNQYDTPASDNDMAHRNLNEYDTPESSYDGMTTEPIVSSGGVSHWQENPLVSTTVSSGNTNSIHRTIKKHGGNSSFLHCVEPAGPMLAKDGATYENISITFPADEPTSISLTDSELIFHQDLIDDEEIVNQRSSEFPTHTVPIAPPPPKSTPRRLMPSMYDNVGQFDRSCHSSEFDDTDEKDNSCNDSKSPESPCDYKSVSAVSEAINPNYDLVESDIPGRYYQEDELDSRCATLSSSPQKLPLEPHESCEVLPTKRNPTLVRMKSDPIVDVEKRAKISKTIGSIQSTFRPISMLNLSNSIASTRQSKQCRSESQHCKPPNFHLSTHRTGFLRRRMSIHSMLSWSKSCIKKPMVFTQDKSQRKEAVEVFKLILTCMGDKSTRRKHDDIVVEIVTRGWSTPSLRDEIFIQLCKQTTGNKRVSSLKQGWELITACLSMFPPSNKFHSYLEGYISRHLDSEDQHVVQANVPKYAKYCHKQLERMCQHGAKRGLKGPTLEEIQASIKRVFNPSMFGNTLDDVLEMQRDRFPEHRLPWILTTLTESVLRQNGLQTEGIFRVPGDIDDVNHMKLTIDQWQSPVHNSDPTVPASLLKLWFRDLYEPLIPQRFYDQCIHNCDDPDISLNIVNSLPPLNYIVFSYLIRLLQAFLIPENVVVSKMDENNLAMVWAPNCLRCPSDDPREIFENTRKEMTFLRTVMNVLDTSFLEGVL